MDTNPFFEFNALDIKERDAEELTKFQKTGFDVEKILDTANALKITRIIQSTLLEWMINPSEDFVRLAAREALAGKPFSGSRKEQFTIITKRAFEQLISEKVDQRLKAAVSVGKSLPEVASAAAPAILVSSVAGDENDGIVTTAEELAGFEIVRAILSSLVPVERIYLRDAKSYCAILLDDNNRKPICRLRFNNVQKLAVATFDAQKLEVITPLDSVASLHNCADKFKITLQMYLADV